MPRPETFQVLLPPLESEWLDECRGDLSRSRAASALVQQSLQPALLAIVRAAKQQHVNRLAKRDLPAVAVSK
jgi:hypothetical protein